MIALCLPRAIGKLLGRKPRDRDPADLRVAAGCAWLDQVRPGWVAEVSPDEIDINDPWLCVGGQLEGSCLAFRERHGLGLAEGQALGFYAYDGLDDAEWAALTAAWRRAVRARKGVAPCR